MTDLATGNDAGEDMDRADSAGGEPPPVTRPASAVTQATGLVGLVGVAVVLAASIGSEIPLGSKTFLLLCSAAVPMVLWSLIVERVYRSPTTGLDFAAPRPLAETFATTKVKLVGLWATWAGLALIYATVETYRDPDYAFFLTLMTGLLPVFLLISVPYVFVIDRVMRAPHDTLWHAGRWLLGNGADPAMLREHVRGWLIKGFWLALLSTALPQHVARVTQPSFEQIFADPALVAFWSIGLLYMVDVAFGVTGYIFTSRLLDAHIRSSNPYLWGWIFALICYPPFILMARGGPLDYRSEFGWHEWLAGSDVLLVLWGVALVALNAVYVWGSVIFGPRFSNLTHRGILTNGPFRFFKHPAYLAKNLNWWLAYLPFLTTMGPLDAARNCLLLLGVNFIYYMRARTEEWHLMEDPDYRAYSDWIAQYGVLARLRRRILGGREPTDG